MRAVAAARACIANPSLTVREAARTFGVSRPTIYAALEIFDADGGPDLIERIASGELRVHVVRRMIADERRLETEADAAIERLEAEYDLPPAKRRYRELLLERLRLRRAHRVAAAGHGVLV